MQDDKTSWGRGLPKRQLIAIAVLVAMGLAGGAAILASGPASSAKGDHGEHAEEGHDDHGHGEKKAADDHKDEHAGESKAAKPEGKEDGHGHGADEAEVIPMTDAQIKSAAIVLETAGPATIRTTTRLPGEIGFNEDRTAHVVPRVAGVVESVPATLGQSVRKGDLLAVIASAQVSDQRSELLAAQRREQLARTTFERERKLWEEKISPRQDVDIAEQALREAEIAVANARQKLIAIGASPAAATGTKAGTTTGGTLGGALTRFELRAPFDGVVVEKHLTLGEQVKEDASVFVLSDLRTVWARLDVPAGDLAKVRVGERAVVRSAAFEQSAEGTVAYVGALIGGQSRTAQARISLTNPDRAWRPGLFVNIDVVTGEAPAPVTVPADAVQVFEERQVVFVRTAEGFAATPVKTGRGDGRRIEIVDGLKAGAKVAAVNAFVVKSEAGKGSATHSH
ncbi:efflux RND transporter periplasmic adaptor subunit [Roseateles chitinivorans]|uniref:efflux RND transporter periplasmic adaptor subunit n=1 Tax=Roseateles chitinivorans TaxID=2917965 RepID=UPI003D67CAD6